MVKKVRHHFLSCGRVLFCLPGLGLALAFLPWHEKSFNWVDLQFLPSNAAGRTVSLWWCRQVPKMMVVSHYAPHM
jgi:hypothetical protein